MEQLYQYLILKRKRNACIQFKNFVEIYYCKCDINAMTFLVGNGLYTLASHKNQSSVASFVLISMYVCFFTEIQSLIRTLRGSKQELRNVAAN